MSKSIKRNHEIRSQSLLGQINHTRFTSPVSCFLESGNYLDNQERCFGELIETDHLPPFYKPKCSPRKEQGSPPFFRTQLSSNSNNDTESIISGISEIKLIKSLSSSPSWSDDIDIDGCRRVKDELEQMDKVLRGIDPIPLNYDVEEYKQWMETFPALSLFGQKEYGPYKIWKTNTKCKPAFDSDEKNSGVDGIPCANLQQYKKEIKKAVIHNIYENISIRLNHGSNPQSSSDLRHKNRSQIGGVNKTQVYLSDCLKNSPFIDIVEGKGAKQAFLTRHNSREDERSQSPSFESLPIMVENSSGSNMMKPVNKYKNDSLIGVSRKKSRRNIILPPIENKWLQTSTQFRSISATPTYSSLLSVKTIKLDSKLLSGRSRDIPHF